MNILACDTATKTGWALCRNGKIIESGVQDFTKQRGDSNGMLFLRFRNWLSHVLQEQYINLVVYERAHYRGGAATEVCVGLTGHLQGVCAELGIDYTSVPTLTLKKASTGSGRADKNLMINAAAKLTGRAPQDDNEADAVMLAQYAWNNYGKVENI